MRLAGALRRSTAAAAPRRRPLPNGPSFQEFVAARPTPPPLEQPRQLETGPLPREVLTDRFGRFHGYLRLSLTERCNLRCRYCMPAAGVSDLTPAPELLTADEIARVAGVFARAGATKVRLTGGEPTLRRDLAEICARVRSAGVASVGLTTNAVTLLKAAPNGGTVLDGLVEAGVDSVNVSLDSLDAQTFARMTRRPPATHAKVLAAVEACAAAGVRTKVNCVVLRGENEDGLAAFARAFPENVAVRFIEWMPFPGNAYDATRLVPYAEMVERVGGLTPRVSADPHDTTKWWTIGKRDVGFITSMSDHFCGSCNRVRVTADGQLKTCLFGSDALSLRDLMRSGASDEGLASGVRAALQRKHFKHGGHEDAAGIAADLSNRPMVKIGG